MRRLPVVILLGAVIAGLAGVWSVRAGASQAGFQAPGGYYTSQKEVQAARLVKDGVPRFEVEKKPRPCDRQGSRSKSCPVSVPHWPFRLMPESL